MRIEVKTYNRELNDKSI